MTELREFIEELKRKTSPHLNEWRTVEALQLAIYDTCGEWLERLEDVQQQEKDS